MHERVSWNKKKLAARLRLEKAQKELEDAEKEASVAMDSFEDTLVVEPVDPPKVYDDKTEVTGEVAETQVDSPDAEGPAFGEA